MKRLAVCLLALALTACTGAETAAPAPTATPAPTEVPTPEPTATPFSVPAPYSDLSYLPELSWDAEHQKQIYQLDEYDSLSLDTYSFNDRTVLVGAEDKTAALLEAGKDPGLGVRSLQARGITGQGVNVAIIDQPLLTDHPEITDAIVDYYDAGSGAGADEGSMHGSAVTSILAGQTLGVAPGAHIYYAATPGTTDSRPYADALRHILETNETLPEGERICVVSVSADPGDDALFENTDLWRAALADTEDAGLLVLTSPGASAGSARLVPALATFNLANRDEPATCRMGQPGAFLITPIAKKNPSYVGVPCAYRTVAEEYVPGQCGYRYDVQGGLSWGIPYCVGVMALGWQVTPTLTNEEMLTLLVSTAAPTADGVRMIDPVKFIEAVENR